MTIATKLRHLAAAALLAIAPAAQAVLPYADGDLILGFRATTGQGSTTCYEVNIGQATQFVGVVNAFTVDLGGPNGILADLEATFGTDWKTREDVFWSVSGVQFAAAGPFTQRTIFATKAEPTAGTQSTPWLRAATATQSQTVNKLLGLCTVGYTAGNDTPGQMESTNSTKALIQDNSVSNSYASHMPGGVNTTAGAAYAFFTNGSLGIENHFGTNTTGSVIDLYQLPSGSAGTPGTFLGAFRINDAGVLTFSSNPGDFVGAADVAFDSATYSVGENGGNATLTIVRTGPTTSAFTVNVNTGDVTATAGTDYTALTSFPVAFASGDTTKTVMVPITDVPGFQGDRTFTASIALASGTANVIAPSTATVTITENDPMPSTIVLSSATYNVLETGGQLTVTLNRTGTVGAVSVNFSTQDGTALEGTNFTEHANTVVTFADGDASETVDVAITDSVAFTGDLTFTVALSGGTNGAVVGSPGTATVTIQETDANPAGQIAFSAAAYTFASKSATGQPNTIVLTLNRTNGTTGAVSAQVALAGGTLDVLDFTFTSPTTVNFADGQATATVNIPLLVGAAPLPGTINFTLGNATNGASIVAPNATTVTVRAPDKIAPKILLTTPKAGKSGANFNVTGTVTEPDPLNRVEVRLNGGAVQLATLVGTAFSLNGLAAENGLNTLTVQAFDINGTASLVKKVTFTYTNERLGLAGIYTGLAVPTGAAPPAGDANNASGIVTVTVTKTGAFTGKVTIGGAVLPISGVFANNGAARFKPALGNTLALVKKGKVPVLFGDLALTIDDATDKVAGTIGATATIDADRAAFDTKINLVNAAVLANKGKYTTVLPSKAQPVLTATQFPQGDGVGGITILKTGKLTFIGTLADGTPVVASAPLSKDYTAPLYATLYAKKGSIAGVVTISLADLANANANSDISGDDFLWLRPDNSLAKVKPKHYPAGWPAGVVVDLVAASYNAAKQTPAVSVFPGLNVAGEATLQFADGKLTAPFTKDVTISTANKVTNVPVTDKTFKLTVVAPTGALLGNFTHSDGTKPAWKGIIYQKGPTRGGYGYFLSIMPKLGPSGESGGVSINAKP